MTTKAERESNAAKQREWVAKQKKKGLKRVRVWAHKSNESKIKAYAQRLEIARNA